MTSDDADALEALLDGVWARRRAELLDRVGLLAAHLERSAADSAAWSEVGAEAHRLTGALGSLGFEGPARSARDLERQVAAHPDGPPDVAAARQVVEHLRDTLAGAQTRPRG